MSRRRTDFRVEELGQRVLPSASPFSLRNLLSSSTLVVHHQPASHHMSEQHPLHGAGIAVYTTTLQVPDVGLPYHLQGAGNFGVLGLVTVTGNIKSAGFIMQGHATGTLTFANAQGSITLQLTGAEQDGPAPLPQQFSYQITSGTGAYANLHDQGTLTLQTTSMGAGFGVASIQI
jgi:hypothetical protein